MKKFLLYAVAIVIYSVIVVALRHSGSGIPNWVFWVICFLLIGVLSWIGNIGKDNIENVHTPNAAKEEDRYYFYNDRCSFEISKEDIKHDDVEKNGLKHTLMTESMLMLILEIRPGMPQFPSDIPMKMTKVSGFECLAAKVGPLATDYNQYFIDCGEFVVQISFTIVSDINKINCFLNSFRLEK